ncbi:GNAT family N-acetyltransferase [Novosphingobium huizhouense]|uniref:GNAT family N-acetyltransferase n=1 Tax=Novosphingobium huizhouense TaxID=2866625 RepID=UPI001CD8B2ED|nr:GNAT family N-acetyltransferase [Novosphingobium huizhouense]
MPLPQPTIRPATAADVPALLDLVRAAGTLDRHTPYTYWALVNAGLVLVAEREGALVGLLTAMRAVEGEAMLLWQVGLREAERGTGLSQRLLDAFLREAHGLGVGAITLTIAEDNRASLGMMRRFAERHGFALEPVGDTAPAASVMALETLYAMKLTRASV